MVTHGAARKQARMSLLLRSCTAVAEVSLSLVFEDDGSDRTGFMAFFPFAMAYTSYIHIL